MGRKPSSNSKRNRALDPEQQESQMIALAVGLAEEQMRNGTASAQVITHYLKLGTAKARLEKEKLARETELLKAKTDHIESTQRTEAMFEEAIRAFKSYSGQEEPDDEELY